MLLLLFRCVFGSQRPPSARLSWESMSTWSNACRGPLTRPTPTYVLLLGLRYGRMLAFGWVLLYEFRKLNVLFLKRWNLTITRINNRIKWMCSMRSRIHCIKRNLFWRSVVYWAAIQYICKLRALYNGAGTGVRGLWFICKWVSFRSNKKSHAVFSSWSNILWPPLRTLHLVTNEHRLAAFSCSTRKEKVSGPSSCPARATKPWKSGTCPPPSASSRW